MLIVDYISDINNHMNSLLEHVHGVINKYNCFINILTIVGITKEKDEGILSLEKIDSIEFENVTLSYDGVNTILNQINLKIAKPITIAIVGKSGAGKTSLVNLIPRFYHLTDGRILINGISFVIAHRINTVKDADLIILIENKKIVEMGKHEDLIQKHGYYYNLYMSKETTNS